jgi:hypothetical protein
MKETANEHESDTLEKILGITVHASDGTRVSSFIAVKRSRLVWVRGMGLGVGILRYLICPVIVLAVMGLAVYGIVLGE